MNATNIDFRTNASGFVIFEHRSPRYRGDTGTWARYDANTSQLTVCLAARGTISSDYLHEIGAFAEAHGIDFNAMHCGDRRTVTL